MRFFWIFASLVFSILCGCLATNPLSSDRDSIDEDGTVYEGINVNISGLEDDEHEELKDLTNQHVQSSGLVEGKGVASSPQMAFSKRPLKNSTTKIISFESMNKYFVLKLEEKSNLLTNLSGINVNFDDSVSENELVDGSAFEMSKMVAIDLEYYDSHFAPSSTPQDLIKLAPSTNDLDKKNIEIFIKGQVGSKKISSFGRFYIEEGKIIGGFMYHDQYVTITSNDQLDDVNKAKHMKSISSKPFLISMQSKASIANEAKERRGGKCGCKMAHKDSSSEKIEKSPVPSGKLFSTRAPKAIESGCPIQPKVLPVGIVADCEYVRKFGGSAKKAQANIINDFNIVSAIFEDSFNVHIGLISIDLMMSCRDGRAPPNESSFSPNRIRRDWEKAPWNVECTDGLEMERKIDLFTEWVGNKKPGSRAGLHHLVSGCVNSQIVGIAWLNQICHKNISLDGAGAHVGSTSISSHVKNQFSVIAHEIAHNFGAVHDCDQQGCSACKRGSNQCSCCPCGSNCDCNSKYLMTPESGGLNVDTFSPCSISDVCSKMPLVATCLVDPGNLQIIKQGRCGDGIRDEGEECDCGGEEGCKDHPCCTLNCKLKRGAECSDDNDGCCQECKIIAKEENYVCRVGNGICAKEAKCMGERECPALELATDGTNCGEDGAKCASGHCTSRDLQCKVIGTRLGLSKSCSFSQNSCSILCESDSGGGTCMKMDANFIDGTPCGYSGSCKAGECSEAAWKSWAAENWVFIGIGLMLLLVWIFIVLVRFIRSRQQARRSARQSELLFSNTTNNNNRSNAILYPPTHSNQFPY